MTPTKTPRRLSRRTSIVIVFMFTTYFSSSHSLPLTVTCDLPRAPITDKNSSNISDVIETVVTLQHNSNDTHQTPKNINNIKPTMRPMRADLSKLSLQTKRRAYLNKELDRSLSPQELRPSRLSPHLEPFADIALPKCALACFIIGLTTPKCPSETDFACQCGNGELINNATPCVHRSCADERDRREALDKVGMACEAAKGRDGTGDSGDWISSTSGTQDSSSRTTTSSSSGSATSEGSGSTSSLDSAASTLPDQDPPTIAPPTISETSSVSPPRRTSNTDEPTPPPTNIPLALLPPSRQLSTAAKAGIALAVSIFALTVFICTVVYILRLKRDLRAAQAAARVPQRRHASRQSDGSEGNENRAQSPEMAEAGIPRGRKPSLGRGRERDRERRRSSHSSSGRKSRNEDRETDDGTASLDESEEPIEVYSPVSPLSPRSPPNFYQPMKPASNTSSSISASARKPKKLKKPPRSRSDILSIVLERSEEEQQQEYHPAEEGGGEDASSVDWMIQEPVPGQREGLVDPLELDGEFTGIVELPTSVTPRSRSLERGEGSEEGGRRVRVGERYYAGRL